MLKKVEANCKRCGREFCKKRTGQDYCSVQCRNAAWKSLEKDALRVPQPRGSVAEGQFSSTKTVACNAPSPPDLGVFVREQIEVRTTSPIPSALQFLTALRAEPGLPAIRVILRSSVMISFGGSTSKNSFGKRNGDPKRIPGR